MKAAVYHQYGPPEVVKVFDVAKPVPQAKEVLVKVHTSTVNRTDTGFRSAEYFVSRFWSGLLKPKFPILGCEFAGIIEEIGADVKTFKKGDAVFGFNDKTWGGHGEYLCIDEHEGIAHMPEGMSFEIAAAMTEGAHYALNNIRASGIQKGQQALVYGSTGAIGSAAVQLLKSMDVMVSAVCGSTYLDLVKSLGADEVIDYQTQDFTQTQKRFDFVFDAVGKTSFGACKPLLSSKGIYISTELGKNGENILYALTTPLFGGKKVLFPIPTLKQADVIYLKELFEKGAYKPIIDRTYSLDQIVEAHSYVESGQKVGNVVIRVSE
ncbi:MAG: NAD(P)-dependent alcohol dehydrogenase [Chitinophagaceae bacterium]|nr:NAD(P)-dependent alcohol dehydrogenase [Chitinophagaceae bacterium]